MFCLPYAAGFAIVSGLLEVIPVLGPLAALAAAVGIAFVHAAPAIALGVSLYNVLMPLVMGSAVRFHPAATLFAVVAGIAVFGYLGGLLAVPLLAAARAAVEAAVAPPLPTPDRSAR